MNATNNGEISTFPSASLMLVDALRTEFPEIKSVAETDWMGPHGLVVGHKKIYLSGAQTGSEFLTMFRFPLLEGRADLVLKDPYSIVLTQSTAKSLFGDENAVGKMVRVDNLHDLKVTGLCRYQMF